MGDIRVAVVTVCGFLVSLSAVETEFTHQRAASKKKAHDGSTAHDHFPAHDCTLVVALLLALVQSSLQVVACHYGLGERRADLSGSQLDHFSKMAYAASLLAVSVHAVSKISTIFVIQTVGNRNQPIKWASRAMFYVVVLWWLVGFFLLAFRCTMPTPWAGDAESCLAASSVYAAFDVIHLVIDGVNVATDVLLVALPAVIIWRLQMARRKKVEITAAFALRLLVAIATIPRMVYWCTHNEFDDRAWALVTPSIWGQVALNLAIIATCVSVLRAVVRVVGEWVSQPTDNGRPTTSGTLTQKSLSRTGSQDPLTEAPVTITICL